MPVGGAVRGAAAPLTFAPGRTVTATVEPTGTGADGESTSDQAEAEEDQS